MAVARSAMSVSEIVYGAPGHDPSDQRHGHHDGKPRGGYSTVGRRNEPRCYGALVPAGQPPV
eukprot:2502350-Rhodomonas_salina.2